MKIYGRGKNLDCLLLVNGDYVENGAYRGKINKQGNFEIINPDTGRKKIAKYLGEAPKGEHYNDILEKFRKQRKSK
jgi:hypothetical protein